MLLGGGASQLKQFLHDALLAHHQGIARQTLLVTIPHRHPPASRLLSLPGSARLAQRPAQLRRSHTALGEGVTAHAFPACLEVCGAEVLGERSCCSLVK